MKQSRSVRAQRRQGRLGFGSSQRTLDRRHASHALARRLSGAGWLRRVALPPSGDEEEGERERELETDVGGEFATAMLLAERDASISSFSG